jgi:cytochrome c-type biogenesis protein CcmE
MLTKKVKNRILFLSILVGVSVLAIIFIIKTLSNNLLYFKTPTEVYNNANLKFNSKIRLGGIVKKNSVTTKRQELKFTITDLENEIIVTYSGPVPNLFVEGQGVIAEGKLKDKKYFIADRILAKHDENYLPPNKKD